MLDLGFDNIYIDLNIKNSSLNNLLVKYNLIVENENEFEVFINYINSLYLDDKEIPEDIIEQIKNNFEFKSYLLKKIQQKMNNIIHDNSVVIYKELVTIINFLSLGKNFNIFSSYNEYSTENIAILFSEYEEYLKFLSTNDKKNFELTFNYYISLIEAFNELCILNQLDVQRKKTLKNIIEKLTNTITAVKYNILLDDNKVNILNNILGKLLFYYSHIPYISTEGKDLRHIIDEYNFLFEKQTDGYNLCKNANFGNANKKQEDYYCLYLTNATNLLLTLIYKVETNFTLNDDFYDLQKFSQIIEFYQENCTHKEMGDFNSLNDFKDSLFDNYKYIYNLSNDPIESFHEIIDNLVLKKNMTYEDMSMIRDILLYSNDLKEEKLEIILELFINIPKIKNDYFEFLKLNIIDIIITKYSNNNYAELNQKNLTSIFDYVRKNKVASHIMSVYSKIYLSLSLLYSNNDDVESQKTSKDLYYKYIKINGEEILNNEYKLINNRILENYGKITISDLELEDLHIKREKYITIGKKVFENYFELKDINSKYSINQKLADLITHIFSPKGLNNDILEYEINYFISQKVFEGLVFSMMEGFSNKTIKNDDIGYESVYIDLFDEYKIRVLYSTVYKNTFEKLFEENKTYIKQSINNLLKSYLKARRS